MKILVYNTVTDPFMIFYYLKTDFSVLLESNMLSKKYGRYSFLFLKPKEVFILNEEDDVFEYLTQLSNKVTDKYNYSDFVFNGGFAGYFSYNFGVDLFKIKRKKDTSLVPKAYFGYFEDFLIIDHFEKKTYASFTSKALAMEFEEILKNENLALPSFKKSEVERAWCNFEKSEYMQAVKRIKDYIFEGDVYQVNLSQRFFVKGVFDPDFLYFDLRKRNYGCYHAYIKFPKASIISTSPELFLRKRGDTIITKPIKGTSKRGKTPEEDRALRDRLYNNIKCRSELLMIVDLERNDFAKICLPESIEVVKLFDVEEYSTVFHLVSTIKGKLLKGMDLKRIIEATFPGGSITGAPKLNAIKIIEELEKCPRGIYCGSIGYISNNFNMDFNIAIRTLVIEEDTAYFSVGGGIVWDSQEEEEWWETIYKGSPFLELLGINDFTGV
ncbi:aminodeoxychorismate synthase component I [Anaerocellum diazotrophicum]|uniref:aminodeoxychorismate synthase n=1 Tax=Caldicellulosiruptor diazotrophicus TaxID=2806205 RepID=A0ABM7NJY4_9FIRM|nr:aminodeoxychorismate synthase component I [Caldicellulosiruptor diazotrophicus]BCS80416.1 aminodeoxychorismate synthase, component I [Caldicellulosiruptor diazotrophicus]